MQQNLFVIFLFRSGGVSGCVVACGMAACVGWSRNMKTKNESNCCFYSKFDCDRSQWSASLSHLAEPPHFLRISNAMHQRKTLMNFSIVLHYRHLAGRCFVFSLLFCFLSRADDKMCVRFECSSSQMNLFRSILSSRSRCIRSETYFHFVLWPANFFSPRFPTTQSETREEFAHTEIANKLTI